MTLKEAREWLRNVSKDSERIVFQKYPKDDYLRDIEAMLATARILRFRNADLGTRVYDIDRTKLEAAE